MKTRSKFVSNSSSSSFIVNTDLIETDPLLILAAEVTERQDEVQFPFIVEDENEN